MVQLRRCRTWRAGLPKKNRRVLGPGDAMACLCRSGRQANSARQMRTSPASGTNQIKFAPIFQRDGLRCRRFGDRRGLDWQQRTSIFSIRWQVARWAHRGVSPTRAHACSHNCSEVLRHSAATSQSSISRNSNLEAASREIQD